MTVILMLCPQVLRLQVLRRAVLEGSNMPCCRSVTSAIPLLVLNGARHQQDSLQLSPRLPNFVRKSRGRKLGGLGVLGLKKEACELAFVCTACLSFA